MSDEQKMQTVFHPKPVSHFQMLPHALARLRIATPEARCLLIDFLSNKDSWGFNLNRFAYDSFSYRSVCKAVRELRSLRFVLKMNRRAAGGRFVGSEFFVFGWQQTDDAIAKLEERTGYEFDRRAIALIPECKISIRDDQGLDGGTDNHFSDSRLTDRRRNDNQGEQGDKENNGKGEAKEASASLAEVGTSGPVPTDSLRSAGTHEPAQAEQEGLDDVEAEAEKMALANSVDWVQDEPDGQRTLLAEKVPAKHPPLPWPAIKRAMQENCPSLRVIDSGSKRNGLIMKFWKACGHSIGAFEVLARRIEASDFLMARNGHKGPGEKGRIGWSWVFDYREKIESGKITKTPRWELVQAGAYDNDKMAFLFDKEKKKQEAVKASATAPRWQEIFIFTLSRKERVNVNEMYRGEPRFRMLADGEWDDRWFGDNFGEAWVRELTEDHHKLAALLK